MANPVLLHLPLRNNLNGRDRNGVVTATAFGAVRFTADGYYAEEATNNLVTRPRSPSCFVYANVTVATDQLESIVHPTYPGIVIDRYTRITIASAGSTNFVGFSTVLSPSLAAGTVISAQLLVRPSANLVGKSIAWNLSESGGATAQAYHAVSTQVLQAGWQLVTLSATMAQGDRTAIYVYGPSSPAITSDMVGGTLDITAVQIEAKPYWTSYSDGSLGTGYSWAGTAHNSVTNRTAAYLTIPPTYLNETSGAVILRAYMPNVARSRGLLDVGPGDWRLYGGLTNPQALIFEVGASSISDIDELTAGAVNRIYTDWLAGSQLGFHINDRPRVAGGAALAAGGTISGANAFIGRTAGGSYLNGSITDVMIFDRPLTTSERAILAATPEWHFGVLQPKIGNVLRVGMGVGVA